jgi:hypothetical protein
MYMDFHQLQKTFCGTCRTINESCYLLINFLTLVPWSVVKEIR